jgi:hypothetical protein
MTQRTKFAEVQSIYGSFAPRQRQPVAPLTTEMGWFGDHNT